MLKSRIYLVISLIILVFVILCGLLFATGLLNLQNGPDLTITNLTTPSSGIHGGTITIPTTIKNQGNTEANNFYVTYYLIQGYSTPIFLGYRGIVSLAAGASNTNNTTFTIPKNVTPGEYAIKVTVDGDKLVTESKENNNVMISTNKINVT